MSDAKSQTARTILQYWAHNMTLWHKMGVTNWPGFRYSDEEQKTFATLAEPVSTARYFAFLILNAIYFIAIAGLVVGFGVVPMVMALDPTFASPLTFFCCLGGGAVVCLAFGIPSAMALTAITLRGLLGDIPPSSVSDDEVATLYRKMMSQFVRVGVIVGILFIPGMLFYMTKTGFAAVNLLKKIVVSISPFVMLMLVLGYLAPAKKK